MGEVGNIVVTVTYRENPSADEEEISRVVDLDTVRIPEGTTLEGALALLPKKIPVYIKAGNDKIEVDVTWKQDPDNPYPIDKIFGRYDYTGGYTFLGELELPFNVSNPWKFKPPINVEIYPDVEDLYETGLDYTLLDRKISGSIDDYTIWYEDDDGIKQGLEERYVNGNIDTRYIYKDDKYHGIHEVFQGENNGKTKEAYYVNDVLDGSYKTWYYNGDKEIEGQYLLGKRTGEWKTYYNNRQLESNGSYENDKETGPWEYYYSNGQLESKGSYSEGEKVGEWEYYDENGNSI